MTETNKTKKTNKKTIALIGLVLLLVASIALVTLAWLQAHDTKANAFTVGDFKEPDPSNPGDSDHPLNPDKLTGHIYEEKWEDNSKLIPDNDVDKDPKIGMGPESEDAVVYVYVQNNLKEADKGNIYFTLNTTDWEPVTNQVQAIDGKQNTYSGGMFKYKGNSGILAGSTTGNVWTGTVFDKVHVDEKATQATLTPDQTGAEGGKAIQPTVTVQCYLHQAKDGSNQSIDVDSVILPAAKKAFGLTN